MKSKYIIVVLLAVILSFTVIFVLGKKGIFEKRSGENENIVFSTIEECEQKTGRRCDIRMCDYVPAGKTFEEVCGKDFKGGVFPVTTYVKSIIAKQWSFEPAEIRVKKGDKVVLIIKSLDVKHGFSLSEFGIDAKLEPGKETRIEFQADKAGSFPFRCSVFCGQGHSEMTGALIVEE